MADNRPITGCSGCATTGGRMSCATHGGVFTQSSGQFVKMDDPYQPNPERAARLAAEYAICQKRGHQASGFVTASNPPQQTCKWCGTRYFYTEPQIQEFNVPSGGD